MVLIINGERVCVYIAHAQNHFRIVVACVTFDLLAVAVFPESSNMPIAD